jgi:hypothetical protein
MKVVLPSLDLTQYFYGNVMNIPNYFPNFYC